MKSNILIAGFLLIGLIVFLGCTTSSNNTDNNQVACTMDAKICPDGSAVGRIAPDCNFALCPVIVGGDKDAHGCIPSAGYSWCEEKQKCLKVWEEDCDVSPDTGAQIANPASTNCIDNNGTLNIIDTNEGQVGMCTLPSGKVCEEWAYFRGEC